MEFKKAPRQSEIPRHREASKHSVRPVPAHKRGGTTRSQATNQLTPSISSALKFSAKIIKAAVHHTSKAAGREAKELFKITEEEFDLDNNPRWQKFRSKVLSTTRKIKLSRKTLLIISGVVLLIIAGLIVNKILHPQTQKNTGTTKPQSYTSTKLEKGTPKYQTLLPDGKSINDLGGWTRVSPSTASPVYAFVDTIDKVGIRVSQQPLPDNLKKPDAVKELAKSFNADQKLSTGDTDIYVGSSAKGPQSVILTKNNLLITITSNAKIDDSKWVDYIAQLN